MEDLAGALVWPCIELLCFGAAYLLVPAVTGGAYSLNCQDAERANPPKILSYPTGVLIGFRFWLVVMLTLAGVRWMLAD